MLKFENPALSDHCMEQCVYHMIVMDWLYQACEAPDNVVDLQDKRVLVSKRILGQVVNVVLELKWKRPKMVTAYLTNDVVSLGKN